MKKLSMESIIAKFKTSFETTQVFGYLLELGIL